MRANSLAEGNAFSEGSSLWVIKNNPSLIWWKKIDLGSKYLLSQNLLKLEKGNPSHFNNDTHRNHFLLGSEDHFFNKWILLWNTTDEMELVDNILKTCVTLHSTSIRFFSDSNIIKEIEARPSASLLNISYIENI